MHITGRRPTRVVALPGEQRLAGYLMPAIDGMGGVTPSLLTLDNGALMRNLMGASTNDSHSQRLWGTRGAAEISGQLHLRLGASGHSPRLPVNAQWPALGELAEKMGHGGGDFWILYYFARQILTGEPAFFDVYRAADVTIPGLLAWRSSTEGGQPYDVPDFRRPEAREQCRHDHHAQPRYDTLHSCFPADADPALTAQFTTTMAQLIDHATLLRAVYDWLPLAAHTPEASAITVLVDAVLEQQPAIGETLRAAQHLAAAYPGSDAARVLHEMLALAEPERALAPTFTADLQRARATLPPPPPKKP